MMLFRLKMPSSHSRGLGVFKRLKYLIRDIRDIIMLLWDSTLLIIAMTLDIALGIAFVCVQLPWTLIAIINNRLTQDKIPKIFFWNEGMFFFHFYSDYLCITNKLTVEVEFQRPKPKTILVDRKRATEIILDETTNLLIKEMLHDAIDEEIKLLRKTP